MFYLGMTLQPLLDFETFSDIQKILKKKTKHRLTHSVNVLRRLVI